MKSHRIRIPKYDMPIRLRPWFLAFTCIVMALLALLGFTSILPLSGELLHFICFCLATGVFYFIVDVEEYVSTFMMTDQPTALILENSHPGMLGEFGFGAILA
jgi:hypothetical protein